MLCEKCCSRQFNIETWKKKQGMALPRNGNGSQCLVFVYNAEQKNDDEACWATLQTQENWCCWCLAVQNQLQHQSLTQASKEKSPLIGGRFK
jgi:hypothetical protein